MQAKGLLFPDKMQVEVEDFDLPETLQSNQILVENLFGLISPGTELAMFTQTHVGFSMPDFGYASYPFRPGYATVGRAIDVGTEVVDLQAGDLVFTRTRHASHAVLSRWEKVPDTMTIQRVPFVALAEVALTSVRLSSIRLGQTVAVFGQGLVGNLTAQLMRCAGARQVIGIDLISSRLAISAQCGIDTQINSAQTEVTDRIKHLTCDTGCQIVVEATGAPQVAPQALKAAAQLGEVILLGSPRGNAEIDLYFDLHRTGVSLIGAHASRQADVAQYGEVDPQRLMLEFIDSSRLQVDPLLTHTVPAAQAEEAFLGLLNQKEDYLGVLLDLQVWS